MRLPPSAALRRSLPRLVLLSALSVLAFFLVLGYLLCLPSNSAVLRPWPAASPWAAARLGAVGRPTAAWFHPGAPGGRKAVLVAHGLNGDRNDMVPRGEFLAGLGYAVLLVDLHAHGETPGRRKTFGWEEAGDLRNGYAYLASRGLDSVYVIGVSLGGAAAVYAYGPEAPFAGMVLEGVYPDIATAIGNRMRWIFGFLGAPFAPLLTWQVPLWLGLRPSTLSVLARIDDIPCPKLLLGGSSDRRTTLEDTRKLYLRAAEPKALWILEGVDHEDFLEAGGEEYRERIAAFLAGRR